MNNVTLTQAKDFANTRETSDEIAQAILEIATDEADAAEIWEEPSDEQKRIVVKRAFELAVDETASLYWGQTEITR